MDERVVTDSEKQRMNWLTIMINKVSELRAFLVMSSARIKAITNKTQADTTLLPEEVIAALDQLDADITALETKVTPTTQP